MNLFDALAQNPYFSNLTGEQLNALSSHVRLSRHDDGHVFIQEGDVDSTVFFVVEGEVVITQQIDGQDEYIETLYPGNFFGLLALISQEPRKATCRAQGDVTVAYLTSDDYEALISSDSHINLAFQRALGAQIAADYRNINAQIRALLLEQDDTSEDTPGEEDTPATESVPTEMDVDVAVIGGGPLGMFYAMWVKRFRPETNIVILERRAHPVHKVGESTLSTTVRAFQAMGLTLPIMRRMFGNKAGLRWFYADKSDEQLQGHFDIIDIEETYQVERRVLETSLQHLMRTRENLDILTSVQVKIRESDLQSDIKRLHCQDSDGNAFEVRAKMVCDATGPASMIPRHMGVYRKAPEMHDTFSYNSYFAYFRPKDKLPIDFWDYPATRHICFREGWLWFISLISWEENTQERIEAMVQHLIDHPNPTDEGLPTREELAEKFDLSYEPIFSIGFTIRTDRDVDGMSIKDRFNHWVNEYPAIAWVLDHFELVEAPYEGKQRSHFAFMNMLHDVTQVAGDGWCAIGDSAAFVNPFLSLGLNYGTGTAYMAAKDSAAALDAGDVSQASFSNYQTYISSIFEQKVRETDMYYRSFNHPLSYERVLALTIANGILDVLPRDGYSDSDPYVFDPLNPQWVDVTKRIVEVQRAGEKDNRDPAAVAEDVREIVDGYIDMLRETTELNDVPLSNYTRFYNDAGDRLDVPNYNKGRGEYEAIPCTCGLYFDDSLAHCPYCGEPNQIHTHAVSGD